MTDDNIVRPVFGKKKTPVEPITEIELIEPAPTPPPANGNDVSDDYKNIGPLTGEALVRAQKDLIYMLANMDFVNTIRDKLEEAGDTIFALNDFNPNDQNIKLRRQGLKEMTLEEICALVENTHQLQWRKQPSYLGALTLEHDSRVQTALSLMNEESGPGPDK